MKSNTSFVIVLFLALLAFIVSLNYKSAVVPDATSARRYSDRGFIVMSQTKYEAMLKEVRWDIEVACKFGRYQTNFYVADGITDGTVTNVTEKLRSLGYKVEPFFLGSTRYLRISWR